MNAHAQILQRHQTPNSRPLDLLRLRAEFCTTTAYLTSRTVCRFVILSRLLSSILENRRVLHHRRKIVRWCKTPLPIPPILRHRDAPKPPSEIKKPRSDSRVFLSKWQSRSIFAGRKTALDSDRGSRKLSGFSATKNETNHPAILPKASNFFCWRSLVIRAVFGYLEQFGSTPVGTDREDELHFAARCSNTARKSRTRASTPATFLDS